MPELALHLLLLLLLPPLLLGVVNRTKAWCGGRRGAPLLQPWLDLVKLLRKGLVLSTTTCWLFRAGPVVSLAALLLAGLLLPAGPLAAPVAFTGDAIFFAYLLGLARFSTTAAALDTGSSFGGMGASREATFACLSEPALLLALLVLARRSGSLVLDLMLQPPAAGLAPSAAAPLVLLAIGIFVVLLAEACRIPVDDPSTHLELTMIHEVMVLDHGGPLLGAVLWAASIKLFLLGSVLLHVVAPFRSGILALDAALFVCELLGLAVAIGVVESGMARLRMARVPYLLVGALLLCGFSFLLLVR